MKIWTRPRQAEQDAIIPSYRVGFETFLYADVDETPKRLMLIATKTINIHRPDNPRYPDTVGYLYLDEESQKLYYSKGVYNRPEYLCDWDPNLAGGDDCQQWHVTITNDGDLVFLKRRSRANPVIYPAGNYANPVIVDFGEDDAPFGQVTNNSTDHDSKNDYFIHAEYRSHAIEDNGTPLYIWKVTKPYTSLESWNKVETYYHSFYGDPWGENPTKEIAHFHTANFDFYSGAWLVSSGDIDEHCRILMSEDTGITWREVAGNGQMWRTIGFVFLPDAVYWATDSPHTNHALYKAPRDANGLPDFGSVVKVTELVKDKSQPTYTTCLLREPYGLLFLDRAEPRSDHKLYLNFWDLEEEKLIRLGIYDRVPGEIDNNRHGFPNQAVTVYQPTGENGIICGSNSVTRRNKMKLLNNDVSDRVGVMKITVTKS